MPPRGCILLVEVIKMPNKKWNEKVDGRRGIDETDSVASCCECTGMMPAAPPEDDDATVCRMLHVHPEPRRTAKEKKQ